MNCHSEALMSDDDDPESVTCMDCTCNWQYMTIEKFDRQQNDLKWLFRREEIVLVRQTPPREPWELYRARQMTPQLI